MGTGVAGVDVPVDRVIFRLFGAVVEPDRALHGGVGQVLDVDLPGLQRFAGHEQSEDGNDEQAPQLDAVLHVGLLGLI